MLNARNNINRFKKYVPGLSINEAIEKYNISNPIKLSSNENPIGNPISTKELNQCIINSFQYPSTNNSKLEKKLKKMYNISSSNIIFGNGSDEVITLAAQSYINANDEIIVSENTFSMYDFSAQITNARITKVPLINYHIDLNGILKSIKKSTKVIYIANPNNPTGLYIPFSEIIDFLTKVPTSVLVVLDHAYIQYSDEDTEIYSSQIIKTFSNVIITHTFSKLHGLAGMRIGYGIANSNIIETIQRLRPPFNVNSIATEAAYLALNKSSFIKKSLELNSDCLDFLSKSLDNMGIQYLSSKANFIFIIFNKNAKDITLKLLKKGIIVRYLESFGFPNCIRVSTGTMSECKLFIDYLKEVTEESA